MTASRARFDQRLAALGPDILGERWGEDEERRVLRRLREDDPTRPIGDALLDQRTVAGLGTIWRSEACFLARLDPWRRTGDVADEEALAALRAVRPPMQVSAHEGFQRRMLKVYGHAERPCPRCGTPIRRGNQWDDNRRTYWCPGCQT
jgi:endonuclease-8